MFIELYSSFYHWLFIRLFYVVFLCAVSLVCTPIYAAVNPVYFPTGTNEGLFNLILQLVVLA